VVSGILKPGYSFKNGDGKFIGTVKELQDQGQNVKDAEAGKRVAVSMPEPTMGRQLKENDVLVAVINDKDLRILGELKDKLRSDEREMLNEYVA
jgi:translation initiation factor 5B